MNFRSPHLLNRESSALLVVDIQQKLIPAIESADQVVNKSSQLIQAANILELPFLVSEQYPSGLGHTVSELDVSNAKIIEEKSMFSCRGCPSFMSYLEDNGFQSVLICGIETHVCVAQTAFDLIASGFQVHVAVDATGSRSQTDRDVAIRRMSLHGIVTTTVESAIFEWCETSSAGEFKLISNLIK